MTSVSGEELGWIDLASPNVFGIEVHDETAPDIETGAFVHMPLQRQVADVHLLGLGRALDLDDVPLVAADWHQHVGTGIRAAGDEPRLVEGESPGHGRAGQFVDGVLLDHARADLQPFRKQLFRKLPHLRALVENGLRCRVDGWEDVWLVEVVPE